jgi:hypothetical protein
MIERTDRARGEMLVLAALTYRGFSDLLRGEPHEGLLRRQISAGLQELGPVRDRWDMVWGPATTMAGVAFDSSAMYVAESRPVPGRYVVAVRGTNPVSLSDWLLGDFVVNPTVAWPFASDAAAISSSTAFGLRTLLGLESAQTTVSTRIGASIAGVLDEAAGVARLSAAGAREVLASIQPVQALLHSRLREAFVPVESVLATALSELAAAQDLQSVERRLSGFSRVGSSELRPAIRRTWSRDGGRTLVEFLAEQARVRPVEVIVTGHSKGGALAPALALWLKDAQNGDEGWDPSGRSEVGCVTFAAPTPGNAAFARRIDAVLGERHQRIVNTNDVVTHAWAADQLLEIPALFGRRSQPFTRLIDVVARDTKDLQYQHASEGVLTFAGAPVDTRSFAQELIHQHLDAYLDRFGLLSEGISALTFFLG